MKLLAACTELWRDEDGATAIEYALIGVLVAVGAIAGFTLLGDTLANLFNFVADEASTAINDATAD